MQVDYGNGLKLVSRWIPRENTDLQQTPWPLVFHLHDEAAPLAYYCRSKEFFRGMGWAAILDSHSVDETVILVVGCGGLARDRGGCRGRRVGEGRLQNRISATLIDCYLFPSPLAWKNTRSCMSSQINKRKPLNRSSPPLVFSSSSLFFHPRGLAVTFPEDKVVTKVTHTHAHSPLENISLWSGGRSLGGGPAARLTKWQQRIDGEATVSLTFSEMHRGVRRRRVPSSPPSPYSHPCAQRLRCKRCHIPTRHCLICVKRRPGSDLNTLCYSSLEKGYRNNP